MKTILLIDKKSTESPRYKQILFDKLIEKLKYFNYDYDLIEVEYKSDRYGPLPAPGSFFDFKMKEFYKILGNYDENEVILYLDAFDVFPLAGPDEVYQKYKSFNADIVFGYEKNLWPNLLNIDRFYPKKDYINCGIYMGINSKIRKIMDYSFAFDTIQFYDDQHAWVLLTRLIRDGIKVEVDLKSDITLNLNNRNIDGYGIVENRLMNFIDETKPCFIHGNNNSFKKYIEDKNKNIINGLLNIEPTKTS
jgi:hypothetical protein